MPAPNPHYHPINPGILSVKKQKNETTQGHN
jgi:hypothetical protein